MIMQSLEFRLAETVVKVEERFRPMLDQEAKEKLRGSEDGYQGKYEPKQVSTGWWVSLARFGVALNFGMQKPNIEVGDTLVLVAHRIPKPPPAGQDPAPEQTGPIPTNVYFSIDADNFYSEFSGKGCGNDFFKLWKPRWREFPAAPPAVVLRGTPEATKEPTE